MRPNFRLRHDVGVVIDRKYIVNKSLRYLYWNWWLREIGKLQPEDGQRWEAALEFEKLWREATKERDTKFAKRLLKFWQNPPHQSLAFRAHILWTSCKDAEELEASLREQYKDGEFPDKQWLKFKAKYRPQDF